VLETRQPGTESARASVDAQRRPVRVRRGLVEGLGRTTVIFKQHKGPSELGGAGDRPAHGARAPGMRRLEGGSPEHVFVSYGGCRTERVDRLPTGFGEAGVGSRKPIGPANAATLLAAGLAVGGGLAITLRVRRAGPPAWPPKTAGAWLLPLLRAPSPPTGGVRGRAPR
jgi:hypothetical protein